MLPNEKYKTIKRDSKRCDKCQEDFWEHVWKFIYEDEDIKRYCVRCYKLYCPVKFRFEQMLEANSQLHQY